MFRIAGLALAGLSGFIDAAQAGDLSEISGSWRTVRHGAEVKIIDCGDASPCGFLQSVDDDVSGGHTRDINNKNPALRDRPLDGLPILWGYLREEEGWRKGRLYNPETGQTFRSSLELISPDRLRVQGCIGPLCRQQIWTRINRYETAIVKGDAHE
ncbi:DUF2147 domain-containing protein [Hyphococcus sp.]|uniref:DUF2147 domain-containing protein n=1 Tax=Hyphococcus sp. TaxID=2038636 RepID=UPI003CCB89FB